MRVRLIYSRRDGACFVPHTALPQVFSRSAARAGLRLMMTQGFSPRPKFSFGPELPAGVVALNEPADIFLQDTTPDNLPERLNSSLPEGFRVSGATFPPEDAPSLGKSCIAAEYLIRHTQSLSLTDYITSFYGASLLEMGDVDGWLRVVTSEPSKNPIGAFVRNLREKSIITGWHQLNIVRLRVILS